MNHTCYRLVYTINSHPSLIIPHHLVDQVLNCDSVILIIAKMKYTLALVAILAAALAATIVVEASAIKAEPRTSLSVGFVTTGDLLLHRGYVYSAPNTVQKDNVTVTWSSNATISAIYATEVGPAETATAWISSGGLGKSHVTVTFHSYGTLGYNYLLDIYGQ